MPESKDEKDGHPKIPLGDQATLPLRPPAPAGATPEPSATAPPARALEHRYEILAEAGRGGMGIVYRAKDRETSEIVALKVLNPEIAAQPPLVERFKSELRLARKITHKNVCRIHEFNRAPDGSAYISMEYVEGDSLRRILNRFEALRWRAGLRIARQICAGLREAHAQGIVHRDLKPENVMVDSTGTVKLMDFGMARSLEPGRAVTGVIMGTPAYMAPEQFEGKAADPRADIYSLGLVLFEMFTGDASFALTLKHLRQAPPPPQELEPSLPEPIAQAILKCLEKDPGERFQSVAELEAAMTGPLGGGVVSGSGLAEHPSPRPEGAITPAWVEGREPQFRSTSDLQQLLRAPESGRGLQVRTPEEAIPSSSAVRATPPEPPASAWARNQYLLLVAGVVFLVVAVTAYRYWHAPRAPAGPPKVTQISHWNKPMLSARLSPDGHTMAFSSPVGGINQVFIILASGGEALQLTRDAGDKQVDSFSSDGTEIYYRRSLGREEEWAVPTLGGSPRQMVSGWGLVTSADGKAFYYLKWETHAIYRASKSGMGEEEIYAFGSVSQTPVALLVFPDGNHLLVATVPRLFSEQISFYSVDVRNRTATELGELSGKPSEAVWAEPGKSVLLSRTVNGLTNLWKYSLADRALTQITSGPGPDFSPMPNPATKGLYYVNGKSSGFLTAYHVRSKQFADLESENASEPAISADGKRLFYVKLLGPDKSELWVSDLDGANKLRLASGGELHTGDWSPDNSQLSFSENTGGSSKGFILGADGRGLRQIGPMEGVVGWIAWSADGKVLYVSTEKGLAKAAVWKANPDGSNPQKFVDDACFVNESSRDGKYLLGIIIFGEDAGIYEISVAEKRLILLIPGVETYVVRFARDGKSFLYGVASHAGFTFYRQAWQDGKLIGKPQVALKLPFAFSVVYGGNAFDFSPDLSTVVFSRPGGQADLYLLAYAP